LNLSFSVVFKESHKEEQKAIDAIGFVKFSKKMPFDCLALHLYTTRDNDRNKVQYTL